jgi:hypothetical protein
MTRNELARAIALYVMALQKGLQICHRDEQAHYILQHLRIAGVLLAEVQLGCAIGYVKSRLEEERRQYAREFLSNYEGDLAVANFEELSRFVGRMEEGVELS